MNCKNITAIFLLLLIGFGSGFFYKSYLVDEEIKVIKKDNIQKNKKNIIIKKKSQQKIIKKYNTNLKQKTIEPIEIEKKHPVKAQFDEFKELLFEGSYEPALDIYANFMGSNTAIKYQNFLFNHTKNLIQKDNEEAYLLIKTFLEVSYDNVYGMYLLSKIEQQKKNYLESIKILYDLKESYLDDKTNELIERELQIVNNIYARQLLNSKNRNKLISFLEILENNNDETYSYEIEKEIKKIDEEIRLSKDYNIKIKLKRYHSNFIVQILLNGHKKVNLILDTGATITSLNKSIAKEIQYKTIKENINTNTAAGLAKAKLVQINKISLGNTYLNDFKVTISKIDISKKFDGLLGMNFLKKFKFYIDQENAILYLNRKL